MGFDYEKVEKAWGKPKKDVLNELEEWLQSMIIIYENEYKDIDVSDHYRCVLDKIQELKKELV